MPEQPTAPRAPDLRYTPASDAELDALSVITPEDVERAKATWRQDATLPMQTILDAEPTTVRTERRP